MSYNVPNYQAQQGSQWVVGGTLTVPSGGSVQVASGGIINVATGGSIRAAAPAAFGVPGFTAGTMATGSVVLTDGGSATVGVGFAVTGFAGVVTGADGSISGVGENRSLYASGSVIIYGRAGTLAAQLQRGTVGYLIFG
jgi:hypothetical protein